MVGRLDLLRRLYQRVIVPDAVVREVIESGAGRVGAAEVQSATWIECITLKSPPEPLLASELGSGEAEVISLAHSQKARLVLIDERRARRIAEQAYSLRVKGSAGILVSAKRFKFIPAVRPLLESMASQGYFLSERLIERACQEVGEG
jgi:predicted nucleic acid-binding protein